ncbi:MAG TPA: hypothetical protein VIG64_02855 [Actinomycetota bacterium]|jgi:hypothetical protein
MALYLLMNLPLGILTLMGVTSVSSRWIDAHRKQRAFRAGRCQMPEHTSPDRICGMPIVAHMDVYGAYGYKFFQWLCDEHARDGERRMRGGLYRIEWLREGATSTHS